MNQRTRIKICGITEAVDAEAAVGLGVDALGFIFYQKSPRYIAPEKAREIIDTLPPFVDAVGVFVDETAEVIDEIFHYCGLGFIQLHGHEPADFCDHIPGRIIKALRVGPGAEPIDTEGFAGRVSGFLLDTYEKGVPGGTGTPFDWERLHGIYLPGPIVLAGGLNPDNVGPAMKQMRPSAVDVNSGVELSPGKKDPRAMERFVLAVAEADNR